jgi:thioredoxin reductase
MLDVLIVGGGPAGLSAALILGRCRREVLVCDAGEPRNAASRAIHGFLTRDGLAPVAELRRLARDQLAPYATVSVRDIRVEALARLDDGRFRARLAGGEQIEARKVLLATGIVDELPDIPGFRELYGRGVWHCPYCDGFELRDRRIAVFGCDAGVVAEARALTTLTGDLVVCSNGCELEPPDRARLAAMNVRLAAAPVVRLEPRPDGLAVAFRSGPALEVAGLFFSTGYHERSALAATLGCRFTREGLVETDDRQGTGVPGLWVAGDAGHSVLLAIVAAGEGATAAFAIHKELLSEAFPT